MTKKDFEFIAGILRGGAPWLQGKEFNEYHKKLCKYFSDELLKKYSRFDKNKFLKACGIEEQYCCHDYNYRNGGKCSNCGN